VPPGWQTIGRSGLSHRCSPQPVDHGAARDGATADAAVPWTPRPLRPLALCAAVALVLSS
jgi:hypothetical protein